MSKIRSFLRTSFVWLIFAPWMIAFTGAASNQLVLIANHDKFPVMVNALKLDEMRNPSPSNFIAKLLGAPAPAPAVKVGDDGMLDDIHCVMTDKTHLNFLADLFDMHDAIYSISSKSPML